MNTNNVSDRLAVLAAGLKERLGSPALFESIKPILESQETPDAVKAVLVDPELLDLYDEGDKLSHSQTKHDVDHAFWVVLTAKYLTDELCLRRPTLLSDEARHQIVPLGAFLHDIGRAVDVDNHADAGMKVSQDYLERTGWERHLVKRIAAIVACHRSEKFIKISIEALRKFPELAIVVIADKCVGDEDRVRPGRAMILRTLRLFGLARRNFWNNAEHDRVNFAIKSSRLIVDSDDAPSPEQGGAIVLKLTFDEKVAPARELLDLYRKRFHSCGRAAKSLGFVFRIEVNDRRYMFDDSANEWKPIKSFQVS